jgi:hypothetical protein
MHYMDASGLTNSFNRYAEELTALERAGQNADDAQVLRVLLARDAVQSSLDPTRKEIPISALQLVNLDGRLKKMASLIAKTVDLKEWNNSFQPPAQRWWWSFDAPRDTLARFNWLWGGITAIAVTFAVSFAVDISSRFIRGTPDTTGTFALAGLWGWWRKTNT